ncbi:hypothetical protein FLX56_17110 [Synechococcus moorigangaii CMS01]|nr:hypothetical protein [Synechococcus moorigangaii CMS01]
MATSQAQNHGFPWLSLGLFCLVYGVFGWLVGEMIPVWQGWFLAHGRWFFWPIDEAIAWQMAWGLGGMLVLLLMVILVAPLRVLHLLFGTWLRSDAKAFFSVLAWACAAVLIISWLEQFVRFLILIAAGMLCNLDLQLQGFTKWQVFGLLSILGGGSFAAGGYLFSQFQVEIAQWWSIFRVA